MGPDGEFDAYLEAGKIMVQRPVGGGAAVFPPRVAAPGSGGPLEWVEASGEGVVYATTITRMRPEKGGDYNVSLIDLAEGCRMMSRVVGLPPDEVTIGLKVRAKIGEVDGVRAVVFEPAEG